ncbi:MAG: hypothetical protein ACTSO9_18565 [Candidatus Helarchaeota archaeon]
MVWQSKISTEEANELIFLLSENTRKNLLARTAVESQLFPVSTYICVACYQLYDQSFQYNIVKKMVDNGCDPRKIGPKCKTISAFLNGLGFQSFAMLYLHGRAEEIFNLGGPEHESEEKKEETKFLLDFFRHLNPNYRNDKLLLVEQSEDENMRVLDKTLVNKLSNDMFEINKDKIKEFKRVIATMMAHNYLDKCDCRAGIFEHGPYILDSGELLVFKEFLFLYTGESIYANRKAAFEWSETEVKSPISNVSIGYTLKDMKSLKFNDWGTMFADPSDFSDNITSIGLWTRELILPTEQEYPDKMGKISPVSWETFKEIGKYAQDALNELYLKIADWDYNKRCLAGVSLYTNFLAIFSAFAGIEDQYDFEIPKKTHSYIPTFKSYPAGAHPFMQRFFRSKKKRKLDPTFYNIVE